MRMRDRDAAFTEYFAARSGTMRSTAFLLCGDWHRAEDLVQIAFTKLYLRWNRVQRHEALDPYVRQVLIRAYIDDSRKARWRREQPQTAKDLIAEADPADDRVMLVQALAEVPARQRAVLVLRYWEDLSVDETAAALRCSPGTVKSQASRGLVTLRNLISRPVVKGR
jgi:RNA polymerase sigma-70 factor (sigma-E family)